MRHLQVRPNRSSILAQVGNASTHHGVWTTQEVRDSRRAREGVQSPVRGLRLVQVTVGETQKQRGVTGPHRGQRRLQRLEGLDSLLRPVVDQMNDAVIKVGRIAQMV